MGKRKLRFDLRKNYERKKRQRTDTNTAPSALIVSLPLTVYSSTLVDASTRQGTDTNIAPSALIVSLPLTAYSSTMVDASTLFSRLRHLECLRKGWFIAEMPETCSSPLPTLMLCKVECLPPHFLPTLTFTVSFNNECKWAVSIHKSHVRVEASNCALLAEFEASLHTVDAVLTLLSSNSKFCAGNCDKCFWT